MLLDISFLNTSIENLGTTLTPVLDLFNIIFYSNYSLDYSYVNYIFNFLNLWYCEFEPTEISLTTASTFFLSNIFGQYIFEIYGDLFSLYVLEPIDLTYAKQIIYKTYLNTCIESSLNLKTNLTINMNFSVIYDLLVNKWLYFFITMFIVYFFTNILKFRYQYGFNFYFTYFKTLSDLGEQEYGSYDDYKFFVFFLIQMFVWYCWIFFVGYTFSLQSESKLVLFTIVIMITILTIPVRLLWDFGLAFGMYVRGAASSANFIVEAFFDIIGVIIIFTRFIVQNIRFLLVFVAFFELFEWTATSTEMNYLLQVMSPLSNNNFLLFDSQNLYFTLLIFCKISFIYLYHLLHLIIVSFMQIGVYLMVSFWLFFFLYTSFFKITLDSYFYNKRN